MLNELEIEEVIWKGRELMVGAVLNVEGIGEETVPLKNGEVAVAVATVVLKSVVQVERMIVPH